MVVLAGGVGASKTSLLAGWIAGQMARLDIETDIIRLADVDCRELARFYVTGASVQRMLRAVDESHGVVVITPVYKASFAGIVKLALDILPQFALALDYALRPVLQSMAARHIVQSTVITTADWLGDEAGFSIGGKAQDMLVRAVEHFTFALDCRDEVAQLGLPRAG